MSLAAEFAAVPRRAPGTACTFVGIRKALNPADNEALTDALNDETLSASTVAQILRARGFDIGGSTVQRHKRRDCACDAL